MYVDRNVGVRGRPWAGSPIESPDLKCVCNLASVVHTYAVSFFWCEVPKVGLLNETMDFHCSLSNNTLDSSGSAGNLLNGL